jgi:hypothetical protein
VGPAARVGEFDARSLEARAAGRSATTPASKSVTGATGTTADRASSACVIEISARVARTLGRGNDYGLRSGVIARVQPVGRDGSARSPQTHPRLTAIVEFDAGGFEGAADGGSRLD